MNKLINENNMMIETLISIFTIEKGELKVLLVRKKDDPYKGYWTLPNKIIKKEETLEDGIKLILENQIGMSEIYCEQNHAFSNIIRNPYGRLIGISYIGLIDSKTVEIKRENMKDKKINWFPINEIPKMAFDHKEILEKAIKELNIKLLNSNVLKNLFPSDFTLPELQNVYENILEKTLDRRNFRKKLLSMDIIEDTGYKNENKNGRPAKLYKFKDEIKAINIF